MNSKYIAGIITLRQFLSHMVWGELDVLFIDLPIGTGDESLSTIRLLPNSDGVIIVPMPSELSRTIGDVASRFVQEWNCPQ
jgi:ATP-binding protein involved in chromosome partitioning